MSFGKVSFGKMSGHRCWLYLSISINLRSGAVAGGGGPGGAIYGPPIVETRREIVNVVGNCRTIVNVVGNCQSCRRGGGGGGEDLK